MPYQWKNIKLFPNERCSPTGFPIIRVYVTKGTRELNGKSLENIQFPRTSIMVDIVKQKDFYFLMKGIRKAVEEYENKRAKVLQSLSLCLGRRKETFETETKRLQLMFRKLKEELRYCKSVTEFNEKYEKKGIHFCCELKWGLDTKASHPTIYQVLCFDFINLKENRLQKEELRKRTFICS